MTKTNKMLASERRAALGLASLYGIRMLGLFLILPVFSLYAEQLQGTTPLLIGLALGSYGLSQALLQIPFGLLSDRFGRKHMIVIGLLIFALGSVIAALADHIVVVIIGRLLQGAGAISAVVLALAADLTRTEQRSKVMAIIGISIGLSFTLALILGPVLSQWMGVAGLFWLTAGLALGAIIIVLKLIPQAERYRHHQDIQATPRQIRSILQDRQLLRIDVGIFILHMILTATFVVLPLALRDRLQLPAADHWQLYLPAMLGGLVLMAPFLMHSERKQAVRSTMLLAIALLALAELMLVFSPAQIGWYGLALLIFFTAFNFLEACLPSLIARLAPVDLKGTAMGVYATSQFSGAFLGGVIAGLLMGIWGLTAVFIFASLALLLWLLISLGLHNPHTLRSQVLNIDKLSRSEAQQLGQHLRQIHGVSDAVVIPADGLVYLHFDPRYLDQQALQTATQHYFSNTETTSWHEESIKSY